MKIKTTELTGAALDWAVAKCEDYTSRIRLNRYKEWEDLGRTQVRDDDYTIWNPSEDWAQGGPIIEREKMSLLYLHDKWGVGVNSLTNQYGPTPLITAMRCFVASKLGDEVEVPE